jgi:hypothetical protein
MASPLGLYLDYFLRWKPAANDQPEGHRAVYGFLASDVAKSILGLVIPMAGLDPAIHVFLGAEPRPSAVE